MFVKQNYVTTALPSGASRFMESSPAHLGRLAVGLLCLLLPLQSAIALDSRKAITQYVHSTWQIEDGLPQNGVTRILETRDGYLWVGTQAGLARFDGVSFTTFDHTNTPSLDRDFISDLVEDSNSTLWIATRNGGVATLHDGLFSRIASIGPRGGTVLANDPDGSLWIGGYGGLKHFRNGLLIRTYTIADGLSGDPVKRLVIDKDHALWIGSPGGVNRLSEGKMQSYSVADGLPGSDVTNLRLIADGTLLVKTQNAEFVQWVHDHFEAWHIPGVASSNVHDVLSDRDGNIWLGSGTEGLMRIGGNKVSRFTAEDGLISNVVDQLYEDHDGNVWVGTSSAGLQRFRDGSFTTFAKAEGLSDDRTYAVIEDSRSDIWTTGPDGLHQLHGGEIRAYKTADKTLYPWSMWTDHASSLLVGTSKKLMQMVHGSPALSPAACTGVPPYLMNGIIEDSAHQIWVATLGGGLARCLDGKVTGLFTASTGLLSNALYAIAQGPDGTIWTGSDNGLNSISNDHVTSYPKLNGLSNIWVVSLYFDSKGILWIGTFGQGLFRMEGGHLTQYTSREGLQNDSVYSILEDNAENLWIGSDNGISQITRQDLDAVAAGSRAAVTSTVFGKADGMKSSDASGGTQPNAWRGRDGRLWFPTGRGVVVVDPARLKLNDRAPPSRVEQLIADETRVDLATAVRLQPGTRRLEIRYTAPNLSSPERTQFRYRLDGFDEQWIPGGNQRVAHYTNLPPGQYTFHVNARVATGPWSTQEGVLAFALSPQFYQTLWFRLLCALALVSLLWGAYRLRVSFLHARAAVLEERQRIAREIHDSLSQSLSGILFQTEAALISMRRAPDMTSTHLISARDLAQSSLDDARYSVWNLSPPVLDQKNLSESLALMARQLAHGRVEELDIQSTGMAWDMQPEAKHHVVMIAQEAISNAIQHGAARTITVNLSFDDDALSVDVSDDGSGFSQGSDVRVPARGYGLRNMRHRSNSLGATLSVTSQIGSGTRVVLFVPRLSGAAILWRRLRGSPIARIDS
ncbi:sensor histidine kinase [Rhodanobacter sp. L36]|uniref:sensor histidine kinase n=1 Tax=Rhodanobacter sp. L36 TaxID=1747221 RepID=UPI00131DA284|nr:sensor histidine kinase [Rhodanobacter sp. L36]